MRGLEVNLPQAIKDGLISASESAEKEAKAAKLGVTSGGRISAWFSRVYHRGYIHGFFRAIGYFRHHAKEGRILRMRELWKGAAHSVEPAFYFPDTIEQKRKLSYIVRFREAEYNEFRRLIELSHGVNENAEGDQDENKAR